VKQRMLARGTACGDEPGEKRFGALPPIPNPESGVKPTDFWNGNRRAAAMLLWAVPNGNQTVNVNAEKVPNPITEEEMSRRRPYTVTLMKDGERVQSTVERYFEQARSDQDSFGARDDQGSYLDSGAPYLDSIHERTKLVTVSDIYAPSGRRTRLEAENEKTKRIEEYQPMPTNHSTLPQHQDFMRRVAAWDLPIGFCDSYDSVDFWLRLIREADWTQFADPYFNSGEFELAPIPDGIDKERVADQITQAQQEKLRMDALYR